MELVLKVISLVLCIHLIQSADSNQTGLVIEDGASLTRMGRLYDNPLFRMLGKVFTHTEGLVQKSKEEIFEDLCDLNPCSAWTKWTDCTALQGKSYGIQIRERTCGVGSPFCIQPKPKGDEDATTQKEFKVCEGSCKNDYNITLHGSCLKLFKETLSRSDADEKCKADGGFVINIYSETKSDDLHEFLKASGVSSKTIWIDGRRSSISSPWTFEYGGAPNWTNWKSGEPSNSGDQYCRVEEDAVRKWYDRNCKGPYWFVCDIPKHSN